MKSRSWKWWFLGALAVVMSYVWYDAFHMMNPETPGIKITAPKIPKNTEIANASTQLRYEPPKTNPFLRPSSTQTQPGQLSRANRPPEILLDLSQQYRLIGLLSRERQSQAVIGFGDSSVVISPGDSLGVWQLLQIQPNAAIFGHDKKRDTLWLYTESK